MMIAANHLKDIYHARASSPPIVVVVVVLATRDTRSIYVSAFTRRSVDGVVATAVVDSWIRAREL